MPCRLIGRLQPPPQHGEAVGQLPVLQRPGVVEAARLPLQQGQVVDRVERYCSFSPAPRVPGHQPVLVDQPHLVHRGDHRQLAVGVLHRHRVVVGVEPDQRQRVGRRPGSTRRASNGCAGSGRNAAWSSGSKLAFGAGLPRVRSRQIGLAALAAAARSALPASRPPAPAPGSSAGRTHQPLDVPLLVGPPHQAEVLLEQVVALQPQELPGQLPLAALRALRSRRSPSCRS